MESEFYGQQPALIDGLNTEISTKLTIIRRPGSSVYNSSTIPQAINRFYENRVSVFNAAQTTTNETIQILADTASTVRDVTGPSTNKVVFTKAAGAGSTFFQSVGNELFFSDGPEQKKLITPNLIWAASESYSVGNTILDSNGNLQVVESNPVSYTITNVAVVQKTITGSGTQNFYVITLSTTAPVIPANSTASFSGLTGYTGLNGVTLEWQGIPLDWKLNLGTNQIAFYTSATTYGPAADTGTMVALINQTGTSGSVQPTWSATIGVVTNDGGTVGGVNWTCFGSPVENWGITPPVSTPASEAQPPTFTPGVAVRYWTPNVGYFGPIQSSILDPNGNAEILVFLSGHSGTTGNQEPAWNTVVGGTTIDNTVPWTNVGQPGTWFGSTNYGGSGNLLSIVDINGNLQVVQDTTVAEMSGTSQPTWATGLGSTTTDGSQTWVNYGPFTILWNSGPYQYAYSFHGVDGSVSTASPLAITEHSGVGVSQGFELDLAGPNTTDVQCDQIWLWRTVEGGSTLFFLDSIPNPDIGVAANWSYRDVTLDTGLNELISAPVDDSNNPPPIGITALAYHLNRVWGAVGNIVFNSQTSGITGNPYTSWDPESFFEFPSNVIRLYPTTNGLIVFTVSDIYVIQGLGDSSSSFFSTPFLQGIGLGNYDGFSVNGAIAYLYTTDNQVCSIDPSSGFSEVGFPIGDQFGPNNGLGTFTPSSAFLTWHFQGSQEKALYVSDRVGNWWRMLPTPSPETGTTWCSVATVTGGFSAVQSVETSPGVHTLLIGPSSSGPILERNLSVYSDNGAAYNAYSIIGSLVLAQPGQLAYVKMVTTDSMKIGTPLTLQVQLDEIAPVSAGYFENLVLYVPDPTQLTAPLSLNAQRFYLSQTQQPAVCRHMQIAVEFGTDTVKNELLSLTVYGSYEQEN